jgi:hypothetical protein
MEEWFTWMTVAVHILTSLFSLKIFGHPSRLEIKNVAKPHSAHLFSNKKADCLLADQWEKVICIGRFAASISEAGMKMTLRHHNELFSDI